MKAFREIGLRKAGLFIFFSIFQLLYLLLFLPFLKKMFLIFLGAKIGRSSILMNVRFFNFYHTGLIGLKIGNKCFIGDQTLIDLYDQVIIEDEVTIAQNVTILTHMNVGYKDHPLKKYFPSTHKPVRIKRGSVICSSST